MPSAASYNQRLTRNHPRQRLQQRGVLRKWNESKTISAMREFAEPKERRNNKGTTKEQRTIWHGWCSTTACGVQPHGSVDEVASPERLERAILDFGAAVSASLYLLPMVFANSSPSVLGDASTMGSATLGSWNAACTCNNFKPREKPTLDFHAKFVRT